MSPAKGIRHYRRALTGATGHYWRSARTYDVIKPVAPPVLVADYECNQLRRILVCTGGKEFAEQAVQLWQNCGGSRRVGHAVACHG
jgi:hypothetical protein